MNIFSVVIILASPSVEDKDSCQCITAIYWTFPFFMTANVGH